MAVSGADQRQLTDAAFASLLDAKFGGVSLDKVRELVAGAYDLDDVPPGPCSPCATDAQVSARMKALGEWGVVL